MKRLLARRERHGWSWPELSRHCGLPVWKLHWWRSRLSRRRRPPKSHRAFVPVQVVEAARRDVRPLEMVSRSGIRILVPADFDTDHLGRVLKALASSC